MKKLVAMAIAPTLALGLVACGGEGPDQQLPVTPKPEPWKNIQPAIFAASPVAAANEIAVGEKLTILGKDFISPQHGRQQLSIRGTFFDQDGQSHPVNLSYEPKHVSEVQLSWRMWPNVVFHPSGDKLGKFIGEIQVSNIGHDGTTLASTALPVELTVKPSLVPRLLQPTSGCNQPVVDFTLDGTPMNISVEAIGLRPGTVDAPLIISWTFLKEHWDIETKHFDISVDPTKLFKDLTGPVVFQERVSNGSTSTIRDRSSTGFLMKLKSDFFDDVSIATFNTESLDKVDSKKDSYFANISIAAVDATGKTASLTFPLEVRRVATLQYDNNQELAERYPAEKVGTCIPGGNIGRQASYREDKNDTRSRDLGWNFNSSAAATLGLPSNPFALALNPSATFGVDYRASVSSSNSIGVDLSAQVLPGLYGVFYRQTSKIHRIAQIWGNTKCGEQVDLGEAVLTDWLFAPDFAQGPSCPPPSNLPPAERFR